MSDEKTEEPTDKKLRDARERGESPKSQDVNTAAAMMAGTVLLVISSWIAGEHLTKLFEIVMQRAWSTQGPDDALALMFDMLKEGVLMSLPYLGCAIVVGFLASFAQVGVQISLDPIMP